MEEAQDPEPFVQEAAEILEKMDSDMPDGMAWLASMKNTVSERMHVVGESGRVRRLFRVMTGINKSIGEAGRRAKNSPIQGVASEVGVVAGYLAYKNCYEYSRRKEVRQHLRKKQKISKITRLVHDATYMLSPYALLLPQIHIGLWSATVGVTDYYEKYLNFKMDVAPEVELELCAREDKTYKWNWEIPELGKIIRKSLEDQKELGNLSMPVQDVMEEVFWPYVNVKERECLYDHWAFLSVPYDKVKNQIEMLLEQQELL